MTEQDPALEPEPIMPQEKTYKVVGVTTVFDHQPGETFTATLSFEQEEQLTTYGHLQVVQESESTEPMEGQTSEATEDTQTDTTEVEE